MIRRGQKWGAMVRFGCKVVPLWVLPSTFRCALVTARVEQAHHVRRMTRAA